ncbi:MAG: hypothetical protein QOE93_160 [Actinomycetota bacterium]|nr:hypothetical protein [Actinomycetota bacterium]
MRFEAGAVYGFVHLRQWAGTSLPYVTRLSTSRAEVVRAEREGDAIRVEIASLAPGTLVVRAGDFGSEWQDEQSAPAAESAPPVHLTLAVDAPRRPLLLEVRHEGEDGAVGIFRMRLQPSEPSATGSPSGDRLSASSELRPDGIGPIDIHMTHDQALTAAGGPMVVDTTEHCDSLRASTGLDGVTLISTRGSEGRITVITVANESVATVEGIHLGRPSPRSWPPTPASKTKGSGDAHRLVHRWGSTPAVPPSSSSSSTRRWSTCRPGSPPSSSRRSSAPRRRG